VAHAREEVALGGTGSLERGDGRGKSRAQCLLLLEQDSPLDEHRCLGAEGTQQGQVVLAEQ